MPVIRWQRKGPITFPKMISEHLSIKIEGYSTTSFMQMRQSSMRRCFLSEVGGGSQVSWVKVTSVRWKNDLNTDCFLTPSLPGTQIVLEIQRQRTPAIKGT